MFEKLKNESEIKFGFENFKIELLSYLLPPEIEKPIEPELRSCVFCIDYKNYMGFDATSTEYNLSRMCDAIVRKSYCVEKGEEFPRVDNRTLCKLHHDKWIVEHSIDVKFFFSSAIGRNAIVEIDDHNPIEVFQLLSDFDKMDFVLLRHYDLQTESAEKEIEAFEKGDPEKILDFGYNEVVCSIQKEFLSNADYYYNYCLDALRKIGTKWIKSLDPKEFDSGYLKMLEEYGPNFAKAPSIPPPNIREGIAKREAVRKNEFLAWLEKAEKKLGKHLEKK